MKKDNDMLEEYKYDVNNALRTLINLILKN